MAIAADFRGDCRVVVTTAADGRGNCAMAAAETAVAIAADFRWVP